MQRPSWQVNLNTRPPMPAARPAAPAPPPAAPIPFVACGKMEGKPKYVAEFMKTCLRPSPLAGRLVVQLTISLVLGIVVAYVVGAFPWLRKIGSTPFAVVVVVLQAVLFFQLRKRWGRSCRKNDTFNKTWDMYANCIKPEHAEDIVGVIARGRRRTA